MAFMTSRITATRIALMLCMVLSISMSMIAISRAQESPTPRVISIIPDPIAGTDTTARFIVTFSEAVTGVDVTDFAVIDNTHHASIQDVVASADPAVFSVTIASNTPVPRMLLALIDDDSIGNTTGTPLGGIGNDNGNTLSSGAAHIDVRTALVPTPKITTPKSFQFPIGKFPSMVLTKTTNLPIISYYDQANGDLKLAICNDAYCGKPLLRTLDSTGNVGGFTSLALTSTNIPVVSYYDYSWSHLKLAICNDASCSNPTIRSIDNAIQGGNGSSLALTSTNIPIISYYDATNTALKLAVCSNSTCSTTTLRSLDGGAGKHAVGNFSSLALTSTNIPVISYYDATNADLKLIICTNTSCSTLPSPMVLDQTGNVGQQVSLKLVNDVPVIAYLDATNFDLKLVHCGVPSCAPFTMRTIRTIDATGNVGLMPSLAINKNGIPIISYQDFDAQSIKLAACTDAYCLPSTPVITTIASGSLPSLVLTNDDIPLISYYDQTMGILKLNYGERLVDQGFPHPFTKTAPADNAINQLTTITFKWNAAAYANGYLLCYATSIDSCNNWLFTNIPTITISNLIKNTTYYWQVRALSNTGMTDASDNYRKFTTAK